MKCLNSSATLALQYNFEYDEHKVIPRPHGNHKKGKVFHKTFESVKNKIRNELDKKSKPTERGHTMLSQQGGIHEITTLGQHVKNRQQASNFKYAMKGKNIMINSLTLWKSVRNSYWTKTRRL